MNVKQLRIGAIIGLISNAALANTPIQVAVAGGFEPVFAQFVPMLSHQLGAPIQVFATAVQPLYQQLQNKQHAYDLVISGDMTNMQQLAKLGSVAAASLSVVANSQVVLWCPNPNVRMRVRLQDTLSDPAVKRIAISRLDSPVGQLMAESVHLPATLEVKRAAHALAAWRLARSKQVDCAFTMRGLMQHTDNYQIIPKKTVQLIGAIPSISQHPTQAAQILALMQSPMVRAKLRRFGYF